MRHHILLITALVCLIVFVAALTAGTILVATTVGWSNIGEELRTGAFTQRFSERFGNWSGSFGIGRISYTIDETRSDDLQGVSTIIIRAVSERVIVSDSGNAFSARLSGSYVGTAQLQWSVQREGSTLVVRTRYPWFGLRMASLSMNIQIPKAYTGSVEIHTVSGSCELASGTETQWKSLRFEGVSGAFQAAGAVWPQLEIKTVSGSIRADSVKGRLTAGSVSGGIDIGYAADAIPESSFDTVSGRVSIRVPAQSKFSLLYTTVSGSLDSGRLPLQIISQANRRTEATLNGGGSQISVKTVSGSLILQPQSATGTGRS